MKIIFFFTVMSIFSNTSFAAEENAEGCVVILTDSEGLTAPNAQGKTGFGETVHRHIRQELPEFSVYSKLVGGSNVASWSKGGPAPYEVTTIENDGRAVNQNGFNVPNGEDNIPIQSIEGQLSHCNSNGPKILLILAGANMLWDGSGASSRNRAFVERIRKAGFHCTWIGPPNVRISHRAPADWLRKYTKLSGAVPGSSNYDRVLEEQVDSELSEQVDQSGGCHYISSLASTDINKIGSDGYHYPSTATNAWAQKLIPSIDRDLQRVIHSPNTQTADGLQSNPRFLGAAGNNYDSDARGE